MWFKRAEGGGKACGTASEIVRHNAAIARRKPIFAATSHPVVRRVEIRR
jgi:hypothetical protein